MELKRGYKASKVGPIPEDWDVRLVQDVAAVRGGKRLPLGARLTAKPTPHPYLRVTDMRWGGVELRDIQYVPEDVFPSIRNYRISSADLFISVAGTLGIVGRIPATLDGANLTENADRLTDIRCDRDLLLYNLMSERIQGAIAAERTVGAQPKLALGRIQKFELALPRRDDEQRAIAAALSDVDALLAGLDRLIAKKRDLKQAAMQQLLTGQTRLPGFSGKWETKRLGDVVTVRAEKVLPSQVPPETSCVELEHIGQGTGRLLELASAVQSSSMKHRFFAGDVLFGRLRPYLRKFWLAEWDGICSTEIWPLRVDPDVVFGGFVHAVVQTDAFLAATGVSYGTHMPRADWAVVRNFEFSLPALAEQHAIATVLSDMDAELTALEARREKTRLLKQGMMQELLTGRTRLV